MGPLPFSIPHKLCGVGQFFLSGNWGTRTALRRFKNLQAPSGVKKTRAPPTRRWKPSQNSPRRVGRESEGDADTRGKEHKIQMQR